MQPKKRILDENMKSLLSVDPLTKSNIDLIKRYSQGNAITEIPYRNDPADRLILLAILQDLDYLERMRLL